MYYSDYQDQTGFADHGQIFVRIGAYVETNAFA